MKGRALLGDIGIDGMLIKMDHKEIGCEGVDWIQLRMEFSSKLLCTQ
jgi:hypothetical protein